MGNYEEVGIEEAARSASQKRERETATLPGGQKVPCPALQQQHALRLELFQSFNQRLNDS